MARAYTGAVVAVKIFEEQKMIAKVFVGLELLHSTEDGAPIIGAF